MRLALPTYNALFVLELDGEGLLEVLRLELEQVLEDVDSLDGEVEGLGKMQAPRAYIARC